MTTRVVDSRTADRGIRRRRECQECGERFTTYEQYQQTVVMIVKKDGRREPFERGKIEQSVALACRKRGVAQERLDQLVSGIQRQIETMGESEVPSKAIGEMVMDGLRQLDSVAYIRFASVYRQFVSVEDMLHELDQLTFNPVPPAEQPRLFEDELARLLEGTEDLPVDSTDPTSNDPTPIGYAPSAMGRR